ncbi:hypothetical protein B0H14DRAFT_3469602 [Mycena olivaceomarginata]|nr:hypothetical protein B0H14DRAFT_3469602 [Mycena olivaceomarginata]
MIEIGYGSYMLPRCAASPFLLPLPRHRVVAVKPGPLARPLAMPHATLASPSPLAAADSIALLSRFHVELILMRIVPLYATFPLTLRRYDLLRPIDLMNSLSHYLNDRDHARAPYQLPFPSPPRRTPLRIIKSTDQQANIFRWVLPPLFPSSSPFPPPFLPQVAGPEELARIVDAICARGGGGDDDASVRFSNWAVQRCLEAATGPEERRKIVSCMRARIVHLAMNCYGYYVFQKALDCEEVCLLIVSELLRGDPATTLVNKYVSRVWIKAALACHETELLVVRNAFENLEDSAKDGIVDELLGQGAAVFGEVAKSQLVLHPAQYVLPSLLEHGFEKHRQMALEHLLTGLLEFATNEQGGKSVVKALKDGGKGTLDRFVQRIAHRAMVVDLALSLTGSQLVASVLPTTGSRAIWFFDRMRAYYGY